MIGLKSIVISSILISGVCYSYSYSQTTLIMQDALNQPGDNRKKISLDVAQDYLNRNLFSHPFDTALIGGSLLGAAVLIFAVPLTSVLKVTIEELVKGLKSYRLV